MVDRSKKRTAFGRPLFKHGTVIKDIADSRIELEMGRLLVLHAARVVDQLGGKNARREVTMIKVAIPNITLKILDRAIQVRAVLMITVKD
jgi:acyl-CoA dehydrogenase